MLLLEREDLLEHVVVLLLVVRGTGKVWPIDGDAHHVHLLGP